MNNTEAGDIVKLSNEFLFFRDFVDILIIACTLFGNILIISSIGRVRQLRRLFSSVLVINLACCDILLVLFSIPTDMVRSHSISYPFNGVGCKMIFPLATYYINCIAITLTLISLERYLIISFNYKIRAGTRKKVVIVIIIHLVAMAFVIPYSISIDLGQDSSGEIKCKELWSDETNRLYTVFLFMVQFAIPLPVLLILNTLSWRTIQKRNLKTLRVLGHIEKITVSSCCCLTKLPNRRYRKGLESKLSVTSEVSIARQKQTKYYLKMFTAVVIIFTISMMPNQITWFYLTFKPGSLNPYIEEIFYWLTYTNSVLNPWIYAGFNPHFKQAYRNFVKKFLSIFLKDKTRTIKDARMDTMIFHQNNNAPPTPSEFDGRKQAMDPGDFLWNTPWSILEERLNKKLSLSSDSSEFDISSTSVARIVNGGAVPPYIPMGGLVLSYAPTGSVVPPYTAINEYVQVDNHEKLFVQTHTQDKLTKSKANRQYSISKEESVPSVILNTNGATEFLESVSMRDFEELLETHC